MRTVKLERITIQRVKDKTQFLIKDQETWLDVDICSPNEKEVYEFIVYSRTLKRLYGMFIKESTFNGVVSENGDIYTEILAWKIN